jgi:ribonuclease G
VISTRIEGELKRQLQEEKSKAILVEMHQEVAAIIIGSGGGNLKKLEEETGRHIFIRGSENIHIEKYRIVARGSHKQIQAIALPVKIKEVLELTIEEPHMTNPNHGIARLQGFVINVENAGDRVGQTVKAEIKDVNRTFARAVLRQPNQ